MFMKVRVLFKENQISLETIMQMDVQLFARLEIHVVKLLQVKKLLMIFLKIRLLFGEKISSQDIKGMFVSDA